MLPEFIEAVRTCKMPLELGHSVSQRWGYIKANKKNVLQLGQQWSYDKRYKAHSSSQIESVDFPACIRNPDSTFSSIW